MQEDNLPYTPATDSRGICAYLRILDKSFCDARRATHICILPQVLNFLMNRYGGIQDLRFELFQDAQSFLKTDVRLLYCDLERTKNLATDCTSRTSKGLILRFHEQLGALFLPML